MPEKTARKPMLFTRFLERIGVKLEAGQEVYCRVCFDGVDPIDLPANLLPVARQLFGAVDRVPEQARRVIAAVCGARSGKTYLGALRLLHLGLTVDLSTLAPGEEGLVAIVAPRLKLARQALRYIKGVIETQPSMLAMVDGELGQDRFVLKRGGQRVAFEIRAANGKGTDQRGSSVVAAMLDESAFFLGDDGHVVNDKDIYDAIVLRVIKGGQTLVTSTPWAEAGLLFELYDANHGNPDNALAVRATTRAMRTKDEILFVVAHAEKSDPDNAAREYGAKFLGSGLVTWFDPKAIDEAVDAMEKRLPDEGDFVSVAGDLGFNKNSSTGAAAHRPATDDGQPDEMVRVGEVLERRPEPGKPLKPSEVCKELVELVQRHHGEGLTADGHYKETAREHLEDAHLDLNPAPTDTTLPFVTARNLLRQGKLRLCNHPLLIQQMKDVRWKALPGGRVAIILKKTQDGRHGDICASAVLAIDDVSRRPFARAPVAPPKPGSARALAALEDAIEERHEARVGRRQDAAWWDDEAANDNHDTGDRWSALG